MLRSQSIGRAELPSTSIALRNNPAIRTLQARGRRDVGDIGSVVADGETGLLIPAGDPDALADALERVISDPSMAEQLGSEGRQRVLSGSSETVADRLQAALWGTI